MQVDPAAGGHVEGDAWQQRAVGDDRAAVGADLAEPGQEVLVAGPGGLEDLDAGLLRALGHRAGDELAAAPRRGVRPGDHGDDLVPAGGEQGVEGGNGDLGGAGEDEPHTCGMPFCGARPYSARPNVLCGETRTWGAG